MYSMALEELGIIFKFNFVKQVIIWPLLFLSNPTLCSIKKDAYNITIQKECTTNENIPFKLRVHQLATLFPLHTEYDRPPKVSNKLGETHLLHISLK